MAALTVEVIPEKYIPLWSKNGYEDHFNDFPTTNGIFCSSASLFASETKFSNYPGILLNVRKRTSKEDTLLSDIN